MSETKIIDDGGPAFEHTCRSPYGDYANDKHHPGMSLRDYFAAAAMQGMYACQDFMNEQIVKQSRTKEECYANTAAWAYKAADAMLAARKVEL